MYHAALKVVWLLGDLLEACNFIFPVSECKKIKNEIRGGVIPFRKVGRGVAGLLNDAHFMPGSSTRKISSSEEKLLRSHSRWAPEQDSELHCTAWTKGVSQPYTTLPSNTETVTLSSITSHPADRPVGIQPLWVTFANFVILSPNSFSASIILEGSFLISYHPSWLCMKSATMIYAAAEAPRYYTLSTIKDDPLNLLIYESVICAHHEVKWEHFYTLDCHHFEISLHYYSSSDSWSVQSLAAMAA